MLIRPSLTDQRIIDCLHTDYGIDVSTLIFLHLGADVNASVYEAQALNQSSYFVKLKRGHHHDISLTIIDLLEKAGVQQIIPPFKTIHGQLSQRIDGFTIIVYPFIHAQNGFNRVLTDEQWLMLGRTLRKIHDIDVPASIQHQLRREAYSPEWREMVKSIYIYIETQPITDEIALKLLIFMKEHSSIIHTIINKAEQLAKIVSNESSTFVLCHSDIHAGNVLVNGNNTFYIIDWDEPIMAPKEHDLMFIGGGVGNVWNDLREEKIFYQGYGETKVNKRMLSYYRCERIVRDIAEFCENLLLATIGGEDRLQSYKHFIAMFEPRGVVDIACKNEEN